MSGDLWDRVKSLFDRALDLPESERSAFLDRECAADDELRRAVEDSPLLFGTDRDNALSSAFNPAALQKQVIALVGDARADLHRLFTAQAESLLQF